MIESLDEVKNYLQENAETEEVKAFLGEYKQTAELNRDNVLEFLNTKDGVPIKQSIADRAVSDGIEKWKETKLPDIVQAEVLKLNPPKTEDQKRLAELEAEVARERAERIRERNNNDTIKYFSEHEAFKGYEKYAASLAELVINSDEEQTKARREKIADIISNFSSDIRAKNISDLAHKPSVGTATPNISDLDKQIAALEKQKAERPGNIQTLASLNHLYSERDKQLQNT